MVKTNGEINLDSLQESLNKKNFLEKSFLYKLRRMFYSHDEIDILYNKFFEMLQRLEKTHTELQEMHKSLEVLPS